MLGYWRNNQCAIFAIFPESLSQFTDSLKSHIPHPELIRDFQKIKCPKLIMIIIVEGEEEAGVACLFLCVSLAQRELRAALKSLNYTVKN